MSEWETEIWRQYTASFKDEERDHKPRSVGDLKVKKDKKKTDSLPEPLEKHGPAGTGS